MTFFYRDRWLSTWVFGAKAVLDGELDRALAGRVRILIDVGRVDAYVQGQMFAESWGGGPMVHYYQYLGPVRHKAPRVYGPDEGPQAAIDAVLYYLYGQPDVAAERLITELTGELGKARGS